MINTELIIEIHLATANSNSLAFVSFSILTAIIIN